VRSDHPVNLVLAIRYAKESEGACHIKFEDQTPSLKVIGFFIDATRYVQRNGKDPRLFQLIPVYPTLFYGRILSLVSSNDLCPDHQHFHHFITFISSPL
jgi:hypothetical protein